MKRPVTSPVHHWAPHPGKRGGYTLIEILVATLLTLIMMGAVVTIFGMIGESISDSRSLLETTDRLRAAQNTLKRDLQGVTATMLPPRRPESAEGYLEYVEGPIGPVIAPWVIARNTETGEPDSTVGDIDDILMFTVHSPDEPFVGRVRYKRAPVGTETPDANSPDHYGQFVYKERIVESQTAEVIWFIRGRTLYRRVLLVLPSFDFDLRLPGQGASGPNPDDPRARDDRQGLYAYNDISAHQEWVDGDWLEDPVTYPNPFEDPDTPYLVPNSLSDLTKPECRFGHHPAAFPCHPHNVEPWGGLLYPPDPSMEWYLGLRLPTLCECSAANWVAGDPLPALELEPIPGAGDFDAWLNPHPWMGDGPDADTTPDTVVDPATGAYPYYYDPANVPPTQRIGEDVILTNVIGFDVKAWDPGAPVVEVIDNKETPGDPSDDMPLFALMPGDPGCLDAVNKRGTTIGDFRYRVASYGAYADLNYMCLLGPTANPNPPPTFLPKPNYAPPANRPEPQLNGPGHFRSRIRGTLPYLGKLPNPPVGKDFSDPNDWPPPTDRLASVYDTWSFHYEHDGIDQDGVGGTDQGTNGFDDDNNGVVDDPLEMETSPPYPEPLRGIQVKLRVFEPDSRQVREVTVKQDFLPR